MTKTNTISLRGSALAIGIVLVNGCASTVPAPLQELEVATTELETARTSGAPRDASNQWQVAQDKFAKAKQLLDQKQNTAARRLLQQATADAKLAAAMAQLQQRDNEQRALQAEIDQLQQGIDGLEQQL
jgi:chromosome segregation ATPase